MMDTEPKDERLYDNAEANYFIDGIRDNNSEIIREIYKKYSPQIINIITNNNGTVQDAKDVLQDVMISIYNQAHNGLKIRCSFSSFLTLICKRRWLNNLSSKYVSKTSSVEDVSISILSINEDVNAFNLRDEKMNLLKDKLKMMDTQCREIIETSWTLNESGKYMAWNEVAVKLDISYAYVRKKASECKKRLIELAQKDRRFLELKY